MTKDIIFELMEAMRLTDESIRTLEDFIGGMIDPNSDFCAIYCYIPQMLEKIVFAGMDADDDTIDSFYDEFWKTVSREMSVDEFYDHWI